MIAWRLARAAYPALDGEGARRHGGRWNAPGTPVVYASAHLSLAVLEALVHTDPDLLPDDLTAYRIEIPDVLAALAEAAWAARMLPPDWRTPEASARVGAAWAAGGGAVLFVPSVLVPEERNVLVNPRHREAGAVRVMGSRPFAFDPRLL